MISAAVVLRCGDRAQGVSSWAMVAVVSQRQRHCRHPVSISSAKRLQACMLQRSCDAKLVPRQSSPCRCCCRCPGMVMLQIPVSIISASCGAKMVS